MLKRHSEAIQLNNECHHVQTIGIFTNTKSWHTKYFKLKIK